ncbi:hypothetical protein [Actinoplanes sp. NPDC049802]|uniref:hypothetical protein n=1 Tax=Actinoplanes sp. NPDC049802 TaxID=3154742 RepID=UPI00340C4692
MPAPPPVPGPPPAVVTPDGDGPRPTAESGERPGQRPSRGGPPRRPGSGPGGDDREADRGLRGLVGSGSSQVSVGAALRARDASRPTDEDLAEADKSLPIVRRNWLPREELPRR